tara:strand:+ start:305 stop:1045 length:741 start_codon:yes stop_codon:yes gene_type:complete
MSKVLVIGDSCTDVFVYGSIDRVCPEAPVPVFKPLRQKENGGMAKNVVSNLKALGLDVDVITNPNDIKKIRYIDDKSNQMVLRVDEHDYCEEVDNDMLEYVVNNEFDAIIISDYCKGFLLEEDIQYICDNCDNVFIDTKKQLGDWIKNANFIKINDLEHKKNFDVIPNYPELNDKLIVTQGKHGCIYQKKVYPTKEVPVKDVSGAGDTFLAGLVYEYIKTNDIEKAIEFAQKCTTEVVQKLGVSTI